MALHRFLRLLDLPRDMFAAIFAHCDQASRVALGRCSRKARDLVWFSGFWKDELTVYDSTAFAHLLFRHRAIFSQLRTLRFGPKCYGLDSLRYLEPVAVNLQLLDLSRVADRLFGFRAHCRCANDNCLAPWIGRQLFQRLKCLRLGLHNYSLGLYMLLDRYKASWPDLQIEVFTRGGLLVCRPHDQSAVMAFLTAN